MPTPEEPRIMSLIVFDYILIFANLDEDEALNIHERLKAAGLEGVLFDHAERFGIATRNSSSSYATQQDLIQNSVLKLVLMSNSNIEDDDEFMTCRNNVLSAGDKAVIPLWLTPKRQIKQPKALYGLQALTGLDPQKESFPKDVQKRLNMGMYRQLKQFKIQELQAQSQVKHITTEHTNKEGTVDRYYIRIENAQNVIMQSAPPERGDVAAQDDSDVLQCYTAPEDFWRNTFANDDGFTHVNDMMTSSSSNESCMVQESCSDTTSSELASN